MLMAMSNAENWLNHTNSGPLFLKWSSHANSAFFKNCLCTLALDILKKSQAFRLKHYGRPAAGPCHRAKIAEPDILISYFFQNSVTYLYSIITCIV